MTGKANLEVRPRFINKGEIAKRLILEYGDGPGEPPEFVICIGDDFTDEGMFLRRLFVCLFQLTITRHVQFVAAVQAASGAPVLGHSGRQFEANAGFLASG